MVLLWGPSLPSLLSEGAQGGQVRDTRGLGRVPEAGSLLTLRGPLITARCEGLPGFKARDVEID